MKLRRQGGFAYIAAVVLLVVVAGVIAATLRLTSSQQATTNDAILIARAGQAARGGIESMMYQLKVAATKTPPDLSGLCGKAPNTVTLNMAIAQGPEQGTPFAVSVTCSYAQYKEGADENGNAVVKNIFTINSTACYGGGNACPGDASAPDYTERRRVATICMTDAAIATPDGPSYDCY